MSEATKATLDQALAEHIADESSDALVVGYVLFVATQTVEQFDREATGYFAEYADNQPHHIATGLAHMLIANLDDENRTARD